MRREEMDKSFLRVSKYVGTKLLNKWFWGAAVNSVKQLSLIGIISWKDERMDDGCK